MPTHWVSTIPTNPKMIPKQTVSFGFANSWIAQQVERQLYTVITQALGDIIGSPIDVQCIALPEQEAATIAA